MKPATIEVACYPGKPDSLTVVKAVNVVEWLPSERLTRDQLSQLIRSGINVVVTKRKL